MGNKSKFTVFILSFIPGLSHLYLGFTRRALVFFAMCCGIVAGVGGMAIILGEDRFLVLIPFALLLIWFFALIDAMSLADRLNLSGGVAVSVMTDPEEGEDFLASNRKMITVALSMVPGAGHMYLGYLREGALLMAVFFFTVFLMGWLNMGFFLFILPVVWFYSLFDALHRADDGSEDQKAVESGLAAWWDTHPQLIGWSLIVVGCLVMLQRIASPVLARFVPADLLSDVKYYLQTAIVAIALIAGGIRLLIGTRVGGGKEPAGAVRGDDDLDGLEGMADDFPSGRKAERKDQDGPEGVVS